MSTKVSLITPCLNGEKTIRDTIESVLNQSYRNIEYIIVDGGSTDRTLDIIEEYRPLFKGRLRCISEKDSGIYNAMNKGIRMSRGELIGIINSDDFYEPYAVERAVAAMSGEKYQLIYGYCRILDKYDRMTYINRGSHEDIFGNIFMHPTCFVTRETYCKYGMFNEHYKVSADCDFLYRLYRKQVTFTQIQEITANYRKGGYSSQKDHRLEFTWVRFTNGGIGIGRFLADVWDCLFW